MTDLQRRPARTQALAVTPTQTTERWEGPVQELRARLRDEARDRRVEPYGEQIDRPGLPRGWICMRVTLTERERVRRITPKRRVWPWVIAGLTSIIGGVVALGWWVYTIIAAAVAGVTMGGWVGIGIVAALLIGGAGTTVVTVATQVTVRRGWW